MRSRTDSLADLDADIAILSNGMKQAFAGEEIESAN